MFDTRCESEAIADDPATQANTGADTELDAWADTELDAWADTELDAGVDTELEDALDWARIERELRQDNDDRTHGNTLPSGLFALEIDTDTQCEDALSDAQLIDAILGFERLTAWAQARQARLLAEFARRRPGDDPTLVATDKPCTMSRYAPDEVARRRRGRTHRRPVPVPGVRGW
jgi:3',5'-cyclic AMP phosphodiesterase CpdA